MDSSHPFSLIGYVLQERHSQRFLHDSSGSIDRAWYAALQGNLMTEVIRCIDGQADGRSVVDTCRGKRTLFTVSIKRALVERPMSPSMKGLTGQLCFSGYAIEAEASLNDTGETLLTMRLLLDPKVREAVRDHGGLVLTMRDDNDTVIVVTPLVSPEVASKHVAESQAVLQGEVDLSKLN